LFPKSIQRAETTAIPVEVLALAFIEFIVVSTLAAVLWYMFSGR